MTRRHKRGTHSAPSGEPFSINRHPQYVLLLLAVLLAASPYIGHLNFFHEWLWDTTGRSRAEWIVTGVAVVLFLLGGWHFRLVFDEASREIRRVRQFFWMPLASATWPFSDLRCIRLSYHERTSGLARGTYGGRRSLLRGLLVDKEGAGGESHYELHAVLKDRRTIFIRYSGRRKPLADLGMRLARITGTYLG